MSPNLRLAILLVGLVLMLHGGYLAWEGERGEDEEDDDDGNGNGTSEAEDGDASEDDDDDAALLETLVGIALVIGMLLPPGFITGKLNW